ncbi:MAG: hypothetical protein K2N54_03960 [Helicobacter sp.]|nr:hypothetical protein [Helicobacter sp.]
MSCSTALRLCYAFGSNIDVARCGWGIGISEQWRIEMFRFAQHDIGGAVLTAHIIILCVRLKSHLQIKHVESQKIPIVIASECNERGNQQARNLDRARIPTRLIASLRSQ